jgi:DNA-directed RNA polymerase specialized sigma24 family protein
MARVPRKKWLEQHAKRRRRAVYLYERYHWSMAKIGEHMGISAQRVSQLLQLERQKVRAAAEQVIASLP